MRVLLVLWPIAPCGLFLKLEQQKIQAHLVNHRQNISGGLNPKRSLLQAVHHQESELPGASELRDSFCNGLPGLVLHALAENNICDSHPTSRRDLHLDQSLHPFLVQEYFHNILSLLIAAFEVSTARSVKYPV